MFDFRVEVSTPISLNFTSFFQFAKNLMISFEIGLDKSSSDVAAEGAILNEMLDIVAKRAALRSNDPYGMNSIESDVSLEHQNTHFAHALLGNVFIWKWLMPIVLCILCMFYLQEFQI